MKKDLASSIVVAIVGAIAAYYICNLFIGPIEEFSFNTITTKIGTELDEPSSGIFNYRAINPTVEVYVGDCTETDENGKCLDTKAQETE